MAPLVRDSGNAKPLPLGTWGAARGSGPGVAPEAADVGRAWGPQLPGARAPPRPDHVIRAARVAITAVAAAAELTRSVETRARRPERADAALTPAPRAHHGGKFRALGRGGDAGGRLGRGLLELPSGHPESSLSLAALPTAGTGLGGRGRYRLPWLCGFPICPSCWEAVRLGEQLPRARGGTA